MRTRSSDLYTGDQEIYTGVLEWRKLGALAIDETMEEAVMKEVIIPEACDEIVATLEDRPEGKVLLACGDDRGMTDESVKYLVAEGLPADEPYARYFGGVFGFNRIAMVAVAAQHGAAGLRRFLDGHDFMNFTVKNIPAVIEYGGLIPTAHSATKAEDDDRRKLNQSSAREIACAYALNTGEITHISGHNRQVISRSKAEFESLFGPNVNPDNMDVIADANRSFEDIALAPQHRGFSTTRSDLIENNIPTMILDLDHARSIDSFVLLNFSRNKLTNPKKAEVQGHKFYANDLTQTAEAIMRTFYRYKLDPELIMAAMIDDITSTRTALTAHDGAANAERLALVRYGDPEDALDYLRDLQ